MKNLLSRIEKLEAASNVHENFNVVATLRRIVQADGTMTPLDAVLADSRIELRRDGETESAFLARLEQEFARERIESDNPEGVRMMQIAPEDALVL